ncbi:TPA: hypothetical protein I7126_03360 [Vibrio vulnificus]|nr:hypothetical protein [Vibrio vulnificus]HAS6112744.1 hypothetical protein [Vibrio vulnificus]HAS6122661.1 hypothetical protein [Vibrio vulnificus]
MLKMILKKVLPTKLFNFIRMKPRITLLSDSLYHKIKYINRAAWNQDPDFRGDVTGIIRKYGHMIDKGLQAENRQSGRGKEVYITLNEYLSDVDDSCETTQWAKKISTTYRSLQDGMLDRYQYSNFVFENKSNIRIKELSKFIKERRSIRIFESEICADISDIKEALLLSIWGPSSCNRQSIVTFVTSDEEKVKMCLKQNKGATAISGRVTFVSVCFDTRAYHLPQESLTGYIDASLGFQNSLLAFHSLGLGACVLNWSHASINEDKKLRDILNIREHYQIAFNVIIGVPKYGAPIPGKKNSKEVIIER